MNSIADQALAFAAVAQFAEDVHEVAATGMVSGRELRLARASILNTKPVSAADVFGGPEAVRRGREIAELLLAGTVTQRLEAGLSEISGYVGNLLKLGARLVSNDAALARLSTGIASIAEMKSDDDAELNAEFAQLYSEVISPLQPRILVNGRPEHLRNAGNVAAIRTLLLAGVRSAVLWHQCGGRIWRVVLFRNALLRGLRSIDDAQ